MITLKDQQKPEQSWAKGPCHWALSRLLSSQKSLESSFIHRYRDCWPFLAVNILYLNDTFVATNVYIMYIIVTYIINYGQCFIHILVVFNPKFFFCPCILSRYHITFSRHVYLGPLLWQFLRLSLFLMTLTGLKIIAQAFCRMLIQFGFLLGR